MQVFASMVEMKLIDLDKVLEVERSEKHYSSLSVRGFCSFSVVLYCPLLISKVQFQVLEGLHKEVGLEENGIENKTQANKSKL
jgi:hypothetical protein